ncbi:MAG: tetratricopeptide repeat protein [Holophaga sp.]|nr:tetratricopeptide repeat protein [Holophaga sp.]
MEESGLWRWRGGLLVVGLALLIWAAQAVVLRVIAGNGLLLVPLALICAVIAGVFYGVWAVRSSGGTDHSLSGFSMGLELSFRRFLVRRLSRPGEAWYRWAMASNYPNQALAFLQEAIKCNHAEALFEYGLYLAEGGLGLGGRVSARDYFRRAAEQGHSEGAFCYAEMIRWGEGALRDSKEAHLWYLHSARRGFAPAMAWLATAFENGEGTERNPKEAAAWQARLAETEVIPDLRGSALQRIRTEEKKVGQYWKHALRSAWEDFFLELATSKAFPWLLLVFGILLLTLFGLFAYVWGITVLATPFWQPIFATLGIILIGIGILAIQLRRRMRYGWRTRRRDVAAEHGDVEACFRVGMEYLRGTHEKPRDPVTAKQWFQKAAEAGHPEAMFQLADLLTWTIAGPRDAIAAEAWFQRAGEAGHVGAKARLEQKIPATDSED